MTVATDSDDSFESTRPPMMGSDVASLLQPNFIGAGRLVLKLTLLAVCGQLAMGNPDNSFTILGSVVGVLCTAAAMGCAEIIASEADLGRFFPSDVLNAVSRYAFKWQAWSIFWGDPTCPGVVLAAVLKWCYPEYAWPMRAWILKWLMPLLIMQLTRMKARSAKGTDNEVAAGRVYVSPRLGAAVELIDELLKSQGFQDCAQQVPVYNLNKLLEFCKVTLPKELLEASEARLPSLMGVFRSLLLWERRDIPFFSSLSAFVLLAYFGHGGIAAVMLAIAVFPIMGTSTRADEAARGQIMSWKLPSREEINVFNCCFMGVQHFFAIYAMVCMYAGKELITGNPVLTSTLLLTFFGYQLTALGVTAGVHRLWSHRSYKAAAPLRLFLAILQTSTFQGSIFDWARDHRVHHLNADTEADPHDSTRGLFYSHIGCYLLKVHPAVHAAVEKVEASDLFADRIVMFQHKYYLLLAPFFCYLFPALIAKHFGECLWTGMLLPGAFRLVLTYHCTWFVNSYSHAFGTRAYTPDDDARDNWFTALFASGEGWHNWHHTFGFDYAASELGALQQYNPTKVFIDAMAMIGLAWDRKRALKLWDAMKKQRAEKAEKSGKKMVESLGGPPLFRFRVIDYE